MTVRPAVSAAAAAARWLAMNRRTVFRSIDFYAGALAALGVGIWAGVDTSILSDGRAIMLAIAGFGLALLAVALTALAIIVTFIDDLYREVLRRTSGGVRGAMLPFEVVAGTAAVSTCIGLVAAAVWAAVPESLQAAALSLAIGTCVWAIVGTLQLVGLTVFHGSKRERLRDTVQDVTQELERRRSAARTPR